MKTKSFVHKLNQITKVLLAMTPAQREIFYKSIQASLAEISVDNIFSQYLIICLNALIVILPISRNGEKQIKHNDIFVIAAIRHLIIKQKPHWLNYINAIFGKNMRDVWS